LTLREADLAALTEVVFLIALPLVVFFVVFFFFIT
jgi:hypothetical protein